MMIKNLKHSQLIVFSLLIGVVLAFTGCQSEDELITGDTGKGLLQLKNIGISVETNDISTRSTIDAPAVSDLKVVLIKLSSGMEIPFLDNETSCSLDAGLYKISAVYGEDNCSTSPYFYGEEEFLIEANRVTSVSLIAKLMSAIIRPSVAADLLQHYASYQLTIVDETNSYNINNNEDFFVSSNRNYMLSLIGINQLGESTSFDWKLNDVKPKTRYIINCNPSLPSFSLPEQPIGNAWSKFIYITPMTGSNMISLPEMADKVMANIVYEVSIDGSNWVAASQVNGTYIVRGLEPSTTYTIRSRFGNIVSTNVQTLTTEGAVQLENGNMENWTQTKVYGGNGTYSTAIYCDYCTNWNTRNTKTTNGASSASGFNNYGLDWRWHSGTVSTSDASLGSAAAEISTLAFYNDKFVGSAGSRSNVYSKYVAGNGTAYVGYLFLGSYDLSNDAYNLGVEHSDRPVSLSFDYKYVPVATDKCIVSAYIYDVNHNVIASIDTFNSSAQVDYLTMTLSFNYANIASKSAYIGVLFQSGTDTAISNMHQVEGSYNSTPFVHDRVVGSVLKIDNVVLNYE